MPPGDVGDSMIPVYINNFNWLTSTRRMVEYVRQLPGAEPVIVDNASTYPPLLDWYDHGCDAPIIRLPENEFGEIAPWFAGITFHATDYFVVTDSDLDLAHVPADVLDVLRQGLEDYGDVVKCGLSLEVRDIPDSFLLKADVVASEKRFWERRRDSRFWDAPLGCTFAMFRGYRCGFAYKPALRADRPYTARHLPWYLTAETLTDESRYYLEHIKERFSALCARLRDSLL